jgi:MFS family permease
MCARHARELMAHQPPGHADNDDAGGQGHQPATGEPPGAAQAPRWAVRQRISQASPALKFVLMVGVMSFFADFTYEGSRSIIGPYLGLLGAGALAISVISGAGEFLGYGLRLFSGRGADRTGRYWPITIGGYVLQMSVVPLLALAGNWQVAALLIIAERVGKAIRNPPRDAMLSHAAEGHRLRRAFGVHEALDQFGAMFGPLLVALILTVGHTTTDRVRVAGGPGRDHAVAAGMVARRLYPRPQDLAGPARPPRQACRGCSGSTWAAPRWPPPGSPTSR